MKPLILINFKTYKEATGKQAIALAQAIAKVHKSNYDIAIAPSLLSLQTVKKHVRLPIYAQHADHVEFGAHTGRISPDELHSLGVTGTILNHAERKIPLSYLSRIVALCKKKGLKTVVCASNLTEVKKIALLHPDYIAYEPKELIGGKVSVTQAKPDIILKAVQLTKKLSPKTYVLCGAGIRSKEDVGHALVLGTSGVLLASALVKASSPRKFLEELLVWD